MALTVAVVVSACGSSSTPKSKTPVASSGSSAPVGATGSSTFAARRAALTACLAKKGITLPAGAGAGAGAGLGGRFGASGASGFRGRFGASGASGFRGRFGASGASGFRGRFGASGASGFGGASSSKYAKAIAACGGFGGGSFGGGGGGGGFARPGGGGFSASSSADRTDVTNFVACVRKNGFDLPNPNFSSKSGVFPRADETNPKFLAASVKCQSLLRFGASSGST
jgi:hypothetical protein